MKTKSQVLLLVTLLAVALVPATFATAPRAVTDVVGVNTVAAKPGDYQGNDIQLTGIVHRVSAARRMVVLIDTSEADCTDACTPATVLVKLGESPAELPKAKDRILVVGKISGEGSPVNITAAEWVTGERAIASRLKTASR